jgi:hypothetical protein
VPDLEDHGTEAAAAQADRAELFRIIALSIDDVRLIEDFQRFGKADAVLSLHDPALGSIELEAHA